MARTAPHLPFEIICLILDFVGPNQQQTFAATSKVSRAWYYASQQYLYRAPRITGKNYYQFAATISPSSTYVKPSPLSVFVKVLDLSMIVHEAKPSMVARLLRRVHGNLEEFIAPQASFGYTCVVALGHCKKLRLLDLTLISQSINLDELFRHISKLPQLVILNFPRSVVQQKDKHATASWPSSLQSLSVGGAILKVVDHDTVLPPNIYDLSISHCLNTSLPVVIDFVVRVAHTLTSLTLNYPIQGLESNSLDIVLQLCPHLEYLLVAVDYITRSFFDQYHAPADHPLRQLDIDSSGGLGTEDKLRPDDVFSALDYERLRALRTVRVSTRLQWLKAYGEDARDLGDYLEAKAEEAHEELSTPPGLWEFKSEKLRRRPFKAIPPARRKIEDVS